MDPTNTMESPDISFLTNVQQDVFTILCSLFPNFSHDVLIDTVTSEVNYIPENENSTVLLNSCIDDLNNRVPLVDLTGGFTPDLSVVTPMETEEVVGGGPTIPRPSEGNLTQPSTSHNETEEVAGGGPTIPPPPEAILTLPSTSRNENPLEVENKFGMYPKEAEKTIGQPSTATHDSISDEEEEHAAVVESGDLDDISDDIIMVADGSDCSSSPPAITIESDGEETSDHIQTNNNDMEESDQLKETKIATSRPILLGTYKDPMNTPSKPQDQINGSDLGGVSMGVDPDVFSYDSSTGNFGVISRETQLPANGVSSSIWHTSEDVGATSSFKSHDGVAETSHTSMSFNVMVNSNIISGKVVSESSSATDRNVLSDLTKDGPSTSLHGLNKSLVTPKLTQTADYSSPGSILCKEAKELKFDLAKHCDQTFNVKSQKDSAGIPYKSCMTTHGSSGQSQVFLNPPEGCSEYKKNGGPKFPPIITILPKTSHTPSTSKQAAKRFESSYCRVHHGVKNCNCRSELGSLSHSSSSLGSSKIDSSVSQPKKRKVEVNEFNNTMSKSHHHSFLGSSNVYSTHTGLAGTSFNSFPVEKKGKEIGKGKGKEMVAKFNGVSTNTLQGYESSTYRSDMNNKTEDVTVGNKTGHLERLPHSIQSTTSITNADRPAGTSQGDLLQRNDFKLPEKMSVTSETGESNSDSILKNSATPSNVCKDAPIRLPEAIRLPWTGATNTAPNLTSIPTNAQRLFQPYLPSRLDLPSTSNGPVMPHRPVAPRKPSTNGILEWQNTRPAMHASLNLVIQNAKQPLVTSRQGTLWKPESSASAQEFLPRNVALAQRQTSNAPDTNRFPMLPNDFLLGREATETVTPGVTQCTCQVMGRPCSCPFPGAGTMQETKKKDLTEMLAQVINLFPDASPDFVSEKLKTGSMSYPDPVQWLCNLMIEEAYPRKPPEKKAEPVKDEKGKKKMKQNYLQDWRELPRRWPHESYCKQVRQVLASVYKLISMTSIDAVMKATKGRLSPALYVFDQVLESKQYKETVKYEAISSPAVNSALPLCLNLNLPGEINDLVNGNRKESKVFRIKVNKKPRSFVALWTNEEILTEITEYRCYQEGVQVELDHQLALDINQKEYDQNQQGIECECCFAEFPFENMVQCFEMHLFCEDCLQRYVKEAIYGQGKGNLACMAPECSSTFPRDQLEKTLAPDILAKYDERCSEESVHKADLENLVRCPHCDYAAILAPELKAFLCQQCGKETCRSCQVDWMEHFGRKCNEVKSEEALRTKYEEKLSEALIRTCNKCKASIVKENGCNKMTCRCGAKMCYICRKPDIDYNHFCKHLRDPHVKGCSKCNACCLWEVAEKVDDKNMTKIKDELKKEQDEKGIDRTKWTVGVPDHLSPGQSK